MKSKEKNKKKPGSTTKKAAKDHRAVALAAGVAKVADDRGERVMALVLLSGVIGTLWWFGGRPARPPRLLGSLGSDREEAGAERAELGGVGRFARPRNR